MVNLPKLLIKEVNFLKFSFTKNDTGTCMDEVLLSLMVLAILTIGIVLIIKAPAFWIIDSVTTKVFGFALTFMTALLVPGLIHRWLTNDKK